jgi:hypothetical protein
MRLYYGELAQERPREVGRTFSYRHDVLKGYTRRNLYLFQVVVKALGTMSDGMEIKQFLPSL